MNTTFIIIATVIIVAILLAYIIWKVRSRRFHPNADNRQRQIELNEDLLAGRRTVSIHFTKPPYQSEPPHHPRYTNPFDLTRQSEEQDNSYNGGAREENFIAATEEDRLYHNDRTGDGDFSPEKSNFDRQRRQSL